MTRHTRDHRIDEHPILPVPQRKKVTFYWNGEPLQAWEGEVISSALFANGIRIFGHHPLDGGAQGIFCANGQCAKCAVIANGVPVKSCMVRVQENMIVQSVEGLPELPEIDDRYQPGIIPESDCDVLIIGGGPAGLSAALELGLRGIRTLIVDDKHELGGKLVLQTHKFFGSVEDSFAGTRGNDIGRVLADQVSRRDSIEVWLNSTVLFAFKDKKVGVLRDGSYHLVTPRYVLNTAGAREKFLRFPGNTLAGIYGAGAFQTLVNRDLVRPSERLFIVGGGNVGLIAGYHALQAGIEVVGLAEAMPRCGGYKVHADKLVRLGVPIYTSHTVLSANGDEQLESVTIVQVDDTFQPIAGTEKTFRCDTLLIAVGLSPVDEFTQEAITAGIEVFSAGDAGEIAEASSAMFNGKIAGRKLAQLFGAADADIPPEWNDKADVLKAHPGKITPKRLPDDPQGVFPVIHCVQEIPCNPCSTSCPTGAIQLAGDPILGNPFFEGRCIGCGKCVTICPGLAITLVDMRKDPGHPLVTVPYEVFNQPVAAGDTVKAVDMEGGFLAEVTVADVTMRSASKTQLVRLSVPRGIAMEVAGFTIQDASVSQPEPHAILPEKTADDAVVCLCERVSVGEIRQLIRDGITDMNQIKAITHAGMGPCGSKTCDVMIRQIFREEGVPPEKVVPNTVRPVFIEVPLGIFAAHKGEKDV